MLKNGLHEWDQRKIGFFVITKRVVDLKITDKGFLVEIRRKCIQMKRDVAFAKELVQMNYYEKRNGLNWTCLK